MINLVSFNGHVKYGNSITESKKEEFKEKLNNNKGKLIKKELPDNITLKFDVLKPGLLSNKNTYTGEIFDGETKVASEKVKPRFALFSQDPFYCSNDNYCMESIINRMTGAAKEYVDLKGDSKEVSTLEQLKSEAGVQA